MSNPLIEHPNTVHGVRGINRVQRWGSPTVQKGDRVMLCAVAVGGDAGHLESQRQFGYEQGFLSWGRHSECCCNTTVVLLAVQIVIRKAFDMLLHHHSAFHGLLYRL